MTDWIEEVKNEINYTEEDKYGLDWFYNGWFYGWFINSPFYIEETKEAISYTEEEKNEISWTEETKNTISWTEEEK